MMASYYVQGYVDGGDVVYIKLLNRRRTKSVVIYRSAISIYFSKTFMPYVTSTMKT